MSDKLSNKEVIEYQSIRYLNLFRLLLSFFFFSITFNQINGLIGFVYTSDIGKLIASIYLAFALLVWIGSVFYKKYSPKIGMTALVLDLPFIISLALSFDGIDKGWAILPVITIGSFSILSRKPYAIIAMPIIATLLLLFLPKFIGINDSTIEFSSIILYALTYIAIALVGIRQSQNYSQSLLLTQIQRKKIIDLSRINELIIDHMHSGVVAFNKEYEVLLINAKAKELIKTQDDNKLPSVIIKKIIAAQSAETINFNLYGEDVLTSLVKLDEHSGLKLLFIEQQNLINQKSQQVNLANLGQLSSTIAHELRNPLAAIYSASELLGESRKVSAEDKSLTKIIIHQIDRSNKIIEDILLMSRPHIADKIQINISEKLSKFKRSYCQHNSLNPECLNIELSNHSLYIKFDNAHLSQLLWNLTENAFKHGSEKKLSIVVTNQAGIVFLDFRNKGKKFEPIVEESLFVPFFTTHTQGTGLGLYICREMCKSNGGKLEYLHKDWQHIFRIHIKK